MAETAPAYDVLIAHSEREADIAAKLRADLPLAGLSLCPHSQIGPKSVQSARVIVALQSGKKPDPIVRAALALALVPDDERLTVTVFVRDDQLALERSREAADYAPYGHGVVRLVYAIWDSLQRPHPTTDNPLETGEDPLVWLKRLADRAQPDKLPSVPDPNENK